MKPTILHGRLRWTTQINYLMAYAYGVTVSQISGPRLGRVFEIEAIFAPAATDEQLRSMLRSLLSIRFSMRYHRVTTKTDGYGLYLFKFRINDDDKDGAPNAEEHGSLSIIVPVEGVLEVVSRKARISDLAAALQNSLGKPVWDHTGLTGRYDFTFRFANGLTTFETDTPSLETAMRETLGLALRKEKGPLDTLVIDNFEEPSPN